LKQDFNFVIVIACLISMLRRSENSDALGYSRVMASALFMNNPVPGLFTGRDCCSGKEVAHEAVFAYREWATTKPMQ